MVIPNVKVPGPYVEVDPTQATQGLPEQPFRVLLIGQRLSAGSASALEPKRVTSANQAEELFGRGSMLAAMFATHFQNSPTLETWGIALDEDSGGNAAEGNFIVNGTATAPGTVFCYVAGERVTIPVQTGDTAAQIATAIAAAITSNNQLPVTAGATGTAVTVTARWNGETGNDIDLRTNFNQGEEFPKGIGVTVTPMGAGTSNPALSSVWPVITNEQFNVIASPYSDTANLQSLDLELVVRFGPLEQIAGFGIVGVNGTYGELAALGSAQNSPHFALMGASKSPTPPYIWAAAMATQIAESASVDPARPFQTLPLSGVHAPEASKRFTFTERNLLLQDGVSTYQVNPAGWVSLERVITTYQETPGGTPDAAYYDANTLFTIDRLRYTLVTRLQNKFARFKLADDGTNFGPGQKVVTPSLLRADILALASLWEEQGLIENLDQLEQGLVVKRADDPSTVDVHLPPNLINGYRITRINLAFRN